MPSARSRSSVSLSSRRDDRRPTATSAATSRSTASASRRRSDGGHERSPALPGSGGREQVDDVDAPARDLHGRTRVERRNQAGLPGRAAGGDQDGELHGVDDGPQASRAGSVPDEPGPAPVSTPARIVASSMASAPRRVARAAGPR